MKLEGRIFMGVAVFCFVMAIVYGVWTGAALPSGVEPAGLVALTLSGGLCLIAGTYFGFVSRRIDPRPEDTEEAEVADGTGEVGFFPPGSYWPVALAASAAIAGLALAFFYWWMIALAVLAVLVAVAGLVFEYHTRPNSE